MSRYLAPAAILFGLLTGSALAHHGWGGYTSADFTLTGTVVDMHLGNPHDRLTVESGWRDVERGTEPAGSQP